MGIRGVMQCAFCLKREQITDYMENIPICEECMKEVAKHLIETDRGHLVHTDLVAKLRADEQKRDRGDIDPD